MKLHPTLFLLAATLIVPSLQAAPLQDPPTITQTELVHRTQLLYDAFAPGDRAPWRQYLAEDVMFFDEQGHDFDKQAMLASLNPLPTGYSGSIHIEHAKVRFAPNVAILSYDADETETVFGTVLHARYHATDTWLYRDRIWQIAASQTLRYYEDPATGAVNAALLNDYVGTYELAPGNQMVVTREGDKLFAKRGAGKAIELLPESPDMFFRAGVEGRRLFHRDASGKVDMLIDRRNNEDLLWKKVS
jgi:hypothetical protein